MSHYLIDPALCNRPLTIGVDSDGEPILVYPMAHFISDKKPRAFPKDLGLRFFRWLLYLKQTLMFPWLPRWARFSTHCRRFAGWSWQEFVNGKSYPIPIVYDFSDPVAGYYQYERWMTDPHYAVVVMPLGHEPGPDPLYYGRFLELCQRYEGSGYNYGQLLAMATGISRFTFGKEHWVCSTGARMFDEESQGRSLGADPRIPPESRVKTPPAWFIAKAALGSDYEFVYKSWLISRAPMKTPGA
jgi:hypothetical protein